LKRGQNINYRPCVFTEHGAVMLANVLRSPLAIRASMQVVRAFVNLRRMLAGHDELARKLEAIERRVGKRDLALQEAGSEEFRLGSRRIETLRGVPRASE
jgi:hypothetical protein